jgi:hypothetical protein
MVRVARKRTRALKAAVPGRPRAGL